MFSVTCDMCPHIFDPFWVILCSDVRGPLKACMEPSDGSPLFHANFWSYPSDFYPNLGLKTSQNSLEPSDFHPDFDLGHHEHCLNLAILTPIGLVLSEVFRSDVYIRGFHGRVIFG